MASDVSNKMLDFDLGCGEKEELISSFETFLLQSNSELLDISLSRSPQGSP